MIDLLIILIIAGFFLFKNFKKMNDKNSNKSQYNPYGDNERQNTNDNFGVNEIKSKVNKFVNSFGFNNASNSSNQSNLSGKNFPNNQNLQKILIAIFGLILFGWIASGFYVLQPDQEGVETTVGKYSKTTIPGLHYKLPYPIQAVEKVKVTTVNTEEIGYRASGSNDSQVLIESTMVTKDENIIDINFDIQWKVADAAKYIFNIKKQDLSSTIRFAAESVMRDLIGRNNMSFVLGEGRVILAEQARLVLQDILDEYEVGIMILSIPIKKIDPPKQVISSFRDVQSARADKEREINMAQAYKNDILPRARGEAAKIVNDAEGYYYSVVNKAKGEVAKMVSLYPLYKENKELVKIRLYTELMNDIFPNVNKIILQNGTSLGNQTSAGNNSGAAAAGGQINFLNLADMFKNMPKQNNVNNNNDSNYAQNDSK